MRGRLAIFGLTACFAVGCSTVEPKQKADANAEAIEEPVCHDCEPFNAIWQMNEEADCRGRGGIWDFNSFSCETSEGHADKSTVAKAGFAWPFYVSCSDNKQYNGTVCPAGLTPIHIACTDGQWHLGTCPIYEVPCNDCGPDGYLK